jgi:hypothetical protein
MNSAGSEEGIAAVSCEGSIWKTFGCHKMQGICLLNEKYLSSHEGLCSIELITL